MSKRFLASVLIACSLIVLSAEALHAQGNAVVVQGKVVDEKGEPLPGVNVAVKGTLNGTSTDADGRYSLETEDTAAVIVFTFVGYFSQEIPLNSRNTLNVRMEADQKRLDEVVVVGYTTVQRKDISGSVASVNVKDLQNVPTSSLLDLLGGKVAGMQSVIRTGVPGGGSGGLVIRGNTNLSESNDVSGLSNPLYIVDGVPMSLAELAGFNVSQNDFFATLNPADIESVDVLKDAAATAIYGVRGSNGVIIIKTKRGRSGKTRMNFGSSFGVNLQPKKLKVFIGEAERNEKVRLYEESIRSLFGEQAAVDVRNGLEVFGYLLPPVLTDRNNPAFNNAYDYQKLFYQKGINQQYNLSMDGGTEKNTYRVGMGYYDEKGVLTGFGFKRYSINASLVSDINSIFHNDFITNFAFSNRVGGQSDKFRSFPASPTELPSSLYYKTPDELALLSGKLANSENTNNGYDFRMSDALRIALFKDFVWDNQASVALSLGRRDLFIPSTATDNNRSYLESNNSVSSTVNLHSILNYLKRINDHEAAALLGTEVNMDKQAMTNLTGEDGPTDNIQVLNGYKLGTVSGQSDVVKTNLLSYFVNLSYGYKDRYKIEGVFRRDGSSRFGANNKWASFPSVKGYWIFSREPWMKETDHWMSFGKLRVSFGTSGSIDGDPLLQYNSFIATNNIGAGIFDINANRMDVKTYNGKKVLVYDFRKIANRSLTWAKSTEADYGIDLELFDKRIYFTGDIYSRYLKGLAFTSYLPGEVGYTEIRSNLVDMISNGWEAALTAYLLPRTGKFQWDWTINLAQTKTVIAKLGNGNRDYINANNNYAFVKGQPAFQYYTYEYLGPLQRLEDLPVNPLTGQPMSYYGADAGLALGQQGKIFPGMPLFTDVNGDYRIDGHDYGNDKKIIQGKSPEPKLYGGISTNIKYNGFNLRVQSSFAFGHYLFNTSLQQMLSQYDDNVKFFTRALYDFSGSAQFWQKPGDDAYYPMRNINYGDGGSARSFRESSMFIEKGDWWDINNVTLSYTFPKISGNKSFYNGLNIYCTVRDVYMWKASKTIPDPRVVSKAGYYNGQGYPIIKNVSIGLNINF
ncbi:MAG: hypothetical protein CRN43_11745 [Candidatus Nephrothrix sp. EaCA]|nr:MAG: hypothetical protein CRN43_11745 [Candidatus Nephrothrix sp. EaCA]